MYDPRTQFPKAKLVFVERKNFDQEQYDHFYTYML